MPSYSHSPEVRKTRLMFARQSRKLVAEMNAILLDPDLSPEAKARRAAPHRNALRELATAAQKDAAAIVEAARTAALAHRPSTLRRAEAFRSPSRTTQVMHLVELAGGSELLEFAKLAASAKDEAAGYAIAAALDQGVLKVDDSVAAAIRLELDSSFTMAATVTRGDFIVAHAEAVRLEEDAESLLAGGALDPLDMLTLANRQTAVSLTPGSTESITSASLEELYRQAGITAIVPAEMVRLVPAASAVFKVIDNPIEALRDANRDANRAEAGAAGAAA